MPDLPQQDPWCYERGNGISEGCEALQALEVDRSRMVDTLYNAEDFINRVKAWDGGTPDELDEILAEVRAALSSPAEADNASD